MEYYISGASGSEEDEVVIAGWQEGIKGGHGGEGTRERQEGGSGS